MALASTAMSGVLNDVGDLSRAQVIDHENYLEAMSQPARTFIRYQDLGLGYEHCLLSCLSVN